MTNKTDPYQPINCDLHSEYEVAILHRVMLQLQWQDDQAQQHIAKVMPLDLKTENQQEFLVAQTNDGVMHSIRLDKIIQSDVEDAIK